MMSLDPSDSESGEFFGGSSAKPQRARAATCSDSHVIRGLKQADAQILVQLSKLKQGVGSDLEDMRRKLATATQPPAPDSDRMDCLDQRLEVAGKLRAFPIYSRREGYWFADLAFLKFPKKLNAGHSILLCIVEMTIRFGHVILLKTKQDGEVAAALRKWLTSARPKPTKLQTDNGGEFTNKIVQDLLRSHGVEHDRVQPYDHSGMAREMRYSCSRSPPICRWTS